MAAHKPRIRLKVQFAGATIGPGKIELLEGVRREGSISAAARKADMTYRRAWHLLNTLQEALGEPLLVTETGGRDKGGAVLTRLGEDLIRLYREAETGAETQAKGLLGLLGKKGG